jgi:hypothetical protein
MTSRFQDRYGQRKDEPPPGTVDEQADPARAGFQVGCDGDHGDGEDRSEEAVLSDAAVPADEVMLEVACDHRHP